MGTVFNADELKGLKGYEFKTPPEALEAIGESLRSIEEAFVVMKEDHALQDLLFERFQEPEGFIIEIGASHPSHDPLGVLNPYLIAQKDRKNSIILGWLTYQLNGKGRTLRVSVPAEVEKRLVRGHPEMSEFLQPEKYAALILSRIGLGRTHEKKTDRPYAKLFSDSSSDWEKLIIGDDLIENYKKNVKEALGQIAIIKGECVNHYGHIDSSINFGLFVNDHNLGRRGQTKLAEVIFQPTHLRYNHNNTLIERIDD